MIEVRGARSSWEIELKSAACSRSDSASKWVFLACSTNWMRLMPMAVRLAKASNNLRCSSEKCFEFIGLIPKTPMTSCFVHKGIYVQAAPMSVSVPLPATCPCSKAQMATAFSFSSTIICCCASDFARTISLFSSLGSRITTWLIWLSTLSATFLMT